MASDGEHDRLSRARAALELLENFLSPVEWFFMKVMTRNSFADPVYKRNVQRLIERNRRSEKSRSTTKVGQAEATKG